MCHRANELKFEVLDKDHTWTELVGNVEIPTEDLLSDQVIEGEFDIVKKDKVRRVIKNKTTV